MKCTNFNEELHVIRTKEVEELKQALLAHGGAYEFADKEKIDANDLEDCPEVTADYYYELIKFKVVKASIYKNDEPYLQVKACTENGACYVDQVICDIPARHVMVGDMAYIIGMMDEPEEKKTTFASYSTRHYDFKKEAESKIVEILGNEVKDFSDKNYEVLVQESTGGGQFLATLVNVSADGFVVDNNGDEEEYELMDMNLTDLCIVLDHLISGEW